MSLENQGEMMEEGSANFAAPIQQTHFNLDDIVVTPPPPPPAPAAAAPVARRARTSIFGSIGFGESDTKSDDPLSPIKAQRRPSDSRILSPYFTLNMGTSNEPDAGPPEPAVPLSEQIMNDGSYAGLFPSWGETRIICLSYGHSDGRALTAIADTSHKDKEELRQHVEDTQQRIEANAKAHDSEHKITLVSSVAIAGCDLLSSCLYTAGTCASYAGKLAPVGLILVTIMLMFFRHVYQEVVSCIPVNGGTYNSILNTTSKRAAALAGCLSILSYVATAIISSYTSIIYLRTIWTGVDVRLGTLFVMFFFCCVCCFGVKESSVFNVGMCGIHIFTMLLLIFWGFAHGCEDGFKTFHSNTQTPLKSIVDESGKTLSGGAVKVIGSIFYGYCSALLGITGFESAANYVESLKSPKTFVQTVNWLWVLVGFFNPVLSVVAMIVLPMEEIYANPGELLAIIAEKLGGAPFAKFVCADAVLILCGGVLTSYVGVVGLFVRLARDKVIPEFVAWETSSGSPVVACILFCIVSASLFVVLFNPHDEQQIAAFGGVYAIAFLSVLAAFACSSILVKLNRGNMARLVIARWWEIWLSLAAVLAGLIGNITLTPSVFVLFIIYLVAFAAVCIYMFLRVDIYSFAIWMLRKSIISRESSDSAFDFDARIFDAARKQKTYVEYSSVLSEEFRVKSEIEGLHNRIKDRSQELRRGSFNRTDSNNMEVQASARTQSSITAGYVAIDVNDPSEPTKAISTRQANSAETIVTESTPTDRANANAPRPHSPMPAAPLSTDQATTDAVASSQRRLSSENAAISSQRRLSSDNTAITSQRRQSYDNADGALDETQKPPPRLNRSGSTNSMFESISHSFSMPVASGAAAVFRRRSQSMDSGHEIIGPEDRSHAHHQQSSGALSLAQSLINGMRRKMSTTSVADDGDESSHGMKHAQRTQNNKKELLELDAVLSHNRIAGWLLVYFMKSLDKILKEPFAYLCKVPDPMILRMAMEYINNNELTNNILLIHFVDDREVMRAHKQFMHNIRLEISRGKIDPSQEERYSEAFLVQSMLMHRNTQSGKDADSLESFLDVDVNRVDLQKAIDKLPSNARELSATAKVLDTHYNKKKVSCILVRGSYFCPTTVKWISKYLNISTHSMIMGTADETFPFPIGTLGGIRIALPEPLHTSRDKASANVIKSSEGLKYMSFS